MTIRTLSAPTRYGGDDAADLRIEVRFKNARLYNALCESGARSVKNWCDTAGVSYVGVLNYLKLSDSPYGVAGEPTPTARRIAAALGMDAGELFPPDLYSGRFAGARIAEVHSHTVSLNAARAERSALPSPEQVVVDGDLGQKMRAVLQTLQPREERVIRLLYGLDDGEAKSIEEVAEYFSVTASRIRQIEAKALRKLRNPSRSRALGVANGVRRHEDNLSRQRDDEAARKFRKLYQLS